MEVNKMLLSVAVVGPGRMGKLAVKELKRRDILVSAVIDRKAWSNGKEKSLGCSDAAIVFVPPEEGYEVVKGILESGKDAIVGTTKFYLNSDGSLNTEMLQEFERLAKKNKCRIVISPNFAIGMNAFWEIVRLAAEIFSKINYDVAIEERHHTGKGDISGTAKKIGEILLEAYAGKKTSLNFGDCERKRRDDEITLTTTRVGRTPGQHKVIFDSEVDTIELIHTVRDPRVFVKGAVDATIFVQDKEPGLYEITDMFQLAK